jgi:hypothetical protein
MQSNQKRRISSNREIPFTKQGDTIHFVLSGESVFVPAKYFAGGSEDRSGVLHHVKLRALLPDFEAYEKSRNHYEFFERFGHGRRIQVTFSSRSQGPAKKIIKSSVAILKNTPVSGRLGDFDEFKYGLEVYRSNSYGIEQWYIDSAYEVDRIEAGGSVLLNHQVDQLVMAMASFDAPSGVGNVIPQDVLETLQPVLAESWQTIA